MTRERNLPAERLARQLLRHEAGPAASRAADQAASSRVCEKLRGPLEMLMGTSGYSALLARAQVLARAEKPAAGGSTDTEGDIAVVEHLLGLLVAFIGGALTVRLLRSVWPRLKDLTLED